MNRTNITNITNITNRTNITHNRTNITNITNKNRVFVGPSCSMMVTRVFGWGALARRRRSLSCYCTALLVVSSHHDSDSP